MRHLLILSLFCAAACGDSEGGALDGSVADSSATAREWEIMYTGGLTGTVGGPICTVTGQAGIITIGCINRESSDAFNASASVRIFELGQDSTTSGSMTLSDNTPCSSSAGATTDLTVTTATPDLYVIEIAGTMDCGGQQITLDGTVETDGVIDLE